MIYESNQGDECLDVFSCMQTDDEPKKAKKSQKKGRKSRKKAVFPLFGAFRKDFLAIFHFHLVALVVG